jgi:hypothetical protein
MKLLKSTKRLGDKYHRPGILERYAELLYRRKIRFRLTMLKLNKRMTTEESNKMMREEQMSVIVIATTFFMLGSAVTCAIFGVLSLLPT